MCGLSERQNNGCHPSVEQLRESIIRTFVGRATVDVSMLIHDLNWGGVTTDNLDTQSSRGEMKQKLNLARLLCNGFDVTLPSLVRTYRASNAFLNPSTLFWQRALLGAFDRCELCEVERERRIAP